MTLEKRLERERAARLEAERIAEQAVRQLYDANAELQAVLANLEHRVSQRTEDLEQFAYVVSHDLQQPLSSLTVKLATLAKKVPPELSERVASLTNDVNRMATFIRDVLSYSQAGLSQTKVEALDSLDLVAHTAKLLHAELEQVGGSLHIGPMPRVLGNKTQLEQVFLNLLQNAIKFRAGQALRIDVEGEPGNPATDNMATIRIRDNGHGIEPELVEQLFDPFRRGTDRNVIGHGVGLATCRRIIERHSGTIRALPQTPGACFELRIPAPRSKA